MSNSIHFEQLFERFLASSIGNLGQPEKEGEGSMGEDSLFGAGHHSRRRASPFAKYSYGVPAHFVKTHRLGSRRRTGP